MEKTERKTVAFRIAKTLVAIGTNKSEIYKKASITFSQLQDILHADANAKARHGVKLLRAMGLLPDQVRINDVPAGVTFWDWLQIMLHAGHFSMHLEAAMDRLEELAATVDKNMRPLTEAAASKEVGRVVKSRERQHLEGIVMGEYWARLEALEGIRQEDVEQFVDLSVAYSPVIAKAGSRIPVEVGATMGRKKYIVFTEPTQTVDALALSVMRYRYLQKLAKEAGQSVEVWFEKLKQSSK